MRWSCRGRARAAAAAMLLGVLAIPAPRARAYWDDVHYLLTYYVARRIGYTPEQAYRVAAACLSTDYDKVTEPSQGKDPTEKNQTPRWMFHALRNEIAFPTGAVGNGPSAKAADEALKRQASKLFEMGVSSRNPGVFLHFLQDVRPHRGFGSAWGHYPLFEQASIDLAVAQKLPIGGSVDWVSHHPKDTNLTLASQTALWLDKFLARACPSQRRRDLSLMDVEPLIDELRKSVAPEPLQPTELQDYQYHFATVKNLVPFDLSGNLPADQKAKFDKHVLGPDLAAAERAVTAMLKSEQMEFVLRSLADARKEFHFTAAGDVVEAQRDAWVLTGSLEVMISAGDAGDQEPVDVIVKAPITAPGETEYDLTPSRSVKVGESVTWQDLPIGNVIVEVRRNDQLLVRNERVTLSKASNRATITLGQRIWVAAQGFPRLRIPPAGVGWQLAEGYPKLEPQGDAWRLAKVAPPLEGLQCDFVPGGTVTLLYRDQQVPPRTAEIIVTEQSVVMRTTVASGDKRGTSTFTFAIPVKPPSEVRPGDAFKLELSGKVSVSGDRLPDLPLRTAAEIEDVFTDNPAIQGMWIGSTPEKQPPWTAEDQVRVELHYPAHVDLDWGMITFGFRPFVAYLSLSLDYRYEPRQ